MRRYFFTVLLAALSLFITLASFPAQAQNKPPVWTLVAESADDEIRVFVNTSTYNISHVADVGLVGAALFRLVGPERDSMIMGMSPVATCTQGMGPLLLIDKNKQKTRMTWAVHGSKLYDEMGEALCTLADLEEKKRTDQQPQSNNFKTL